jgi:hypothetical protein
MIDPRLAPLLAEALSLKMDVSLKLSDGEYDIFWDGLGRICATQEEVCAWLDHEIAVFCKSRGRVRTLPSFADLRPRGGPLVITTKFSEEEIEKLRQAFSSPEPGTIVQIKDKYLEIASLATSPYRTAADQERLLSFQEEAARISKHTKPAGNSEEG